jgi:signal transduction histidine kinase
MRSFLLVRDASFNLNHFVSILRFLPDGIILTDKKEVLYLNKMAKGLLQIDNCDMGMVILNGEKLP